MAGDQLFIGSDDVLPAFHCLQQEGSSRLDSAHDFDDRVDCAVRDHFRRIPREHRGIERDISRLLRVGDGDLDHLHPRPCSVTDPLAVPRKQPDHGRPNGSAAEESDVHVSGS